MTRFVYRVTVLGFCLAFSALLSLSTADARQRAVRLPAVAISSEVWQTETGLTSHPVGWEDFCQKYPTTCQLRDNRPGSVKLNAETWALILQINTSVNTTISPLSDEEHWGIAESWDYPEDGFGDCEDYALQKRRLLHEAGLPLAALMMTVVRDLDNAGHAVLTVRTDRGDFILDNKRNRVLLWSETGYSYVKRQANLNPNRWVSLGTTPPAIATAAQ
ncbi:transglutaminase-like cysteine peptidase [Pseudochelatococcus sp. G4_1912]|uniref:transglutaminase-like cysteine peptidase n=1 Tax=Pseudochelatococcus sp. G4_1912 TaxID=3114288 RepID=UPI0039C5D5F4